MKTYQQIKLSHETAFNDLITKYQVFFAFSDEQFVKGMEKIGVKNIPEMASIGACGYIKKELGKAFFDAMDAQDKLYKKELKDAKQAKEQAILYELNNHESFYAGNIEPVFDFFSGIYTKADIIKVYKKHVNNPHKAEDRLSTNIND